MAYSAKSRVPSPVQGQQITSREADTHDASSRPTELLLKTQRHTANGEKLVRTKNAVF